VLEVCELRADVSAEDSSSPAGGVDWMALETGIAVAGSINEDAAVSDTAGAKTFASPIAEADEPAWADAIGAVLTRGLDDNALRDQY
jgi:hypothetical protein